MNRRNTNRNLYKPGTNNNYAVPNQQFNNSAASQQNRTNQNTAYLTTPPSTSPVHSGPCVQCSSVTVLVCQRCGDFFCSPLCQQNNWPKHRYICFQMPSLVHSSERTRANANMPALNGYQNKPLPPTGPPTSPTANPMTQHRKWVNNSVSPQSHQQPQQQQRQQPQKQNRSTPPKGNQKEPEKSSEKLVTNLPTAGVNIGRVEQVSFPKSNTSVLLTAFRTSNRVFIRSIAKEENEGYCAVIKAINDCGRTAGPLKTMPTRNTFAITDFNQDGLYYRVQVVSVKSENEINVIYFDFGNEATKKLSELKEISKECAGLKQYIVLATLKNVPYIQNCDKLNTYLKSLEDVEAKIVYSEKEKPECDFIIYGVKESLNQQINTFIQKSKHSQAGSESAPQQKKQEKQEQTPPQHQQEKIPPAPQSQTRKQGPSQLAKPVMVPPFENVILPANGRNLNVIVVDNSLLLYGYFGCLLAEDRANLQSIQKYLSNYEDNGRPYKPKIEEYCLAKFEGTWYRAKALSMDTAEYFEVVFIDFSNESQVSTKDIRRYPMDLDLPCKTSLCMIDGLPTELGNELYDYLSAKLQPGTELKIDEVKGIEDAETDVLLVKIKQIEKWLKEKESI